MKLALLPSALLLVLASCSTNKHVNPWERQSSALDPVGITSKKMAAKANAEQAVYKPGDSVTFKKEKLVEFEDGRQGYVSLSEIVNPQEAMGFFPVSGTDMFGQDGGLLPLPANMGAVSPEAAAASRELDLNTSLVPVQPGNSGSPAPSVIPRPSPAPVENMPLPESSVKQ